MVIITNCWAGKACCDKDDRRVSEASTQGSGTGECTCGGLARPFRGCRTLWTVLWGSKGVRRGSRSSGGWETSPSRLQIDLDLTTAVPFGEIEETYGPPSGRVCTSPTPRHPEPRGRVEGALAGGGPDISRPLRSSPSSCSSCSAGFSSSTSAPGKEVI